MSYEISNNVPHVGYKRCGDYVVKLEIFGENNGHRNNVVESCKKYAKFRTSKALVQEIFNLDKSVSNVSEVKSDYDTNFVYKKDEFVEVENFDKDLNEVCSEGIHYFLSFEAAKFYAGRPASKDYTGEWKEFDENGQLLSQGGWKNGKEEGEQKRWHGNGQLSYRGEWKHGVKNGVSEWRCENGNLLYRGEWNNGKEVC